MVMMMTIMMMTTMAMMMLCAAKVFTHGPLIVMAHHEGLSRRDHEDMKMTATERLPKTVCQLDFRFLMVSKELDWTTWNFHGLWQNTRTEKL